MKVIIRLNIRIKRLATGLSQGELANRAGVSPSYLSDLERGKFTNPGVEVICRLALALNCTLEDLVDYREEG